MNPIIYVDGRIADDIGRNGLRELGQAAVRLYRNPVDVLTHGPSKYHAKARYTFTPDGATDE